MAITPEQNERLSELLQMLGAERKYLKGTSQVFVDDMIRRHDEYGDQVFVSPKQWAWLESLYEQHAKQPDAGTGRNRLDEEDDDGIAF